MQAPYIGVKVKWYFSGLLCGSNICLLPFKIKAVVFKSHVLDWIICQGLIKGVIAAPWLKRHRPHWLSISSLMIFQVIKYFLLNFNFIWFYLSQPSLRRQRRIHYSLLIDDVIIIPKMELKIKNFVNVIFSLIFYLSREGNFLYNCYGCKSS